MRAIQRARRVRSSGTLIGYVFLVGLCACGEGATEPVDCLPTGAPSVIRSSAESSDPQEEKGNAVGAAMVEYASLDPRQTLPLRPMMAWHQKQNMMRHLEAIQGVVEALGVEDWEKISEASSAIEASAAMQQMCEHMGAGAEGFTARALDFHERALAIGAAARKEDGGGVLRATAHTLQACTGCHAAFRQEIVDAQTWTRRTGAPASEAGLH